MALFLLVHAGGRIGRGLGGVGDTERSKGLAEEVGGTLRRVRDMGGVRVSFTF